MLPLSLCFKAPLVGLSGLEPPTSRLSGVRSNRLSYKPIFPAVKSYQPSFSLSGGGDKRDRTVDPLLAKQVLSQLSYTPTSSLLMLLPGGLFAYPLKFFFKTFKIKQYLKSPSAFSLERR